MRSTLPELPHGLILAPMAGYTDEPMRALCRRLGADFTVTEMVSAAALCYGDPATAALARLSGRDTPAAIQLFGHDPDQMARAVRILLEEDPPVRPAAIDLNMGCPVRKIACSGDGSGLMRTPALAAAVTEAAVRAAEPFGVPVTVKMRAGWDRDSVNAPEIARAAAASGASAVCVHARTRTQMYAPGVDWSVIARVRDALPPDIPVIGNGDVASPEEYFRLRRETGCDAVAIGRAALGNPWLFSEIVCALEERPFVPPTSADRAACALALAHEVIARAETERGGVHMCRGRTAYFLRGLRGAAHIRQRVNAAETEADLAAALTL